MALMASSYAFFIFARATTPTWALELSLFAQGVGLACVTPPTTATVMAAVPREKAGAGSAIGNTMRQVGGAVGVAVFGTILASIYRAHITPALRQLPPLARDNALMHSVSASISATQAYSAGAGAKVAARLAEPAITSFTAAMHIVAFAAVVLGLAGASVALRWLPARSPSRADAPAAGPREHATERPQPALR
jgi:MFS family permease